MKRRVALGTENSPDRPGYGASQTFRRVCDGAKKANPYSVPDAVVLGGVLQGWKTGVKRASTNTVERPKLMRGCGTQLLLLAAISSTKSTIRRRSLASLI